MKKTIYFLIRTFCVIILIATIISRGNISAQNVLVTDDSNYIAKSSAVLDIKSSNKGLLIPRVSLTSTISPLPISSPDSSLIVYNKATAGDVAAGYYYWDGSKWILLSILNGSFSLGSVPFAGAYSRLTENNSQFFWNNSNNELGIGTNTFDATNPEKLLVNAGTTTSANAIVAKGIINNYFQININNLSNGSQASSDIVATADNGNESTNYIDMGINGSGYTGGYVGNSNDAYLYGSGNNFLLGNISTGKDVVFFSNGSNAYANERMRITSTGNIGIGNNSPSCKLDIAAGVTTSENIVNAIGSINDFLQYNVQNTSTGTHAQSGYSATADNGSATTGFAWIGINNSTFNFPTAYNIGIANDVSFLGSGQDMYIANANNSKSIIFSTGTSSTPYFSEKMRITNAGNVGIGANAPNSTLQVVGSVSTNITTQTGSTYSITATDFTVLCNKSSIMTVTLPTAVGITGRIYIIKNISTNSGSTVTINTTSSQTIDGSASKVLSYMGNGSYYSGYTLQSNGSNWFIQGGF